MTPELRDLFIAAPLVIGGVAAALVLKRAWATPSARRPWLILIGWVLVALVLLVPSLTLGGAQGPFIASTLVSVAALAVVGRNIQIRQARTRGSRSLAPEPSDRPSRAWRGWLRAALAGPLGMVAAMGVAIAYVTLVPGLPQDRIVIGGLMIPVLWGAAMAWTLADDRILRATAVLVGVSLVTFGAAWLKGFS